MSVSLFETLLNEEWILGKKDSYWVIKEEAKNSKNSYLEIGGCRSIAFSLDKAGSDPFPYIKNNTTLKGVRNVCDGLIVAEVEDNGRHECIFIALDLKSEKTSSAPKQIHAGNLVFKYLIHKMNYLKHTSITDLKGRFIGVVSHVGRRQTRKGTTTRRRKRHEKTLSNCGTYEVIKVINENKINIKSFLREIDFSFE